MNRQLIFWSLTAALSGFLFGFDMAVISGAEQAIQKLWDLSPTMHGWAMSMALWGTVAGSLLASWPTDNLGRKKTLLSVGLFFLVSAIWSATTKDPYSFMVARFIGGVGVGISTVAAPLFISEIAPAHLRGRLAGLFQFNIVFGVLIAFASNAALGGLEENGWRWMLGVEAFPAIAYCLLCLGLPESPRWLVVKKNNRPAAKAILQKIEVGITETQLEDKLAQFESTPQENQPRARFWTAQFKTPILLAFLIAFFNQLSGINAVLYFAPRIFALTGLESQAALLQSVGIGITNLLFTFVGLWLIDKLGRRTLLYIGSFGYIISLSLCAWAFASQSYAIVPICIFAFIAAHAVGQGAVIWIFIGEIFPNAQRAMGQSLGCATHWIFAALLTLVFPTMVANMQPSTIFGFFAFMMVLQLIWVKMMVPETKGRSLEDIGQELGCEPKS